MFNFLRIFSPYADPFEEKVDRFFCGVKSSDNIQKIRKNLLALMQENLLILNVWLEKKYKGYKYLTKGMRKKMYGNERKMIAKFQEYSLGHAFSIKDVRALLAAQGLIFPGGADTQLLYLTQIMSFLAPGKFYRYIKTASFGKLLCDPDKSMMEGDCNQIVTLYIYLFSLKFRIENLQIKLLPEHVCLHFRGIDIEATNGSFQKYSGECQVLPVTEIISTNLLDLADFREEIQSIAPRDMVKSAQLAYAISSLRSVVEHNLGAAYQNLAVSAMKVFNFETAKFYAEKSGNKALLRSVRHNEAVYFYEHKNLDKAVGIFSTLGEEDMVKACLQKQYNNFANEVSGVKTIEQARKYKSTYRKMLELAGRIGNQKLSDNVQEILKKINI
ncbi:hypothetical protein HYW82_02700 [Candidatus Peregrinibacteria bacterium]|nr:hypothetical protein [Candidatus Peregrinibacteria bacterium]